MTFYISEGKGSFAKLCMQMEYVALECYKTGMKASVIKDLPEYLRFRDQYIILTGDNGVAGYIRWFPVKNEFLKKILREGSAVESVTSDEIGEFKIGGKCDVLIHSAPMLRQYASDEVIESMASFLLDKLRSVHRSGRFIGNIVMPASNETEKRICSLIGLELIRDDGDCAVYYAPGKNIL